MKQVYLTGRLSMMSLMVISKNYFKKYWRIEKMGCSCKNKQATNVSKPITKPNSTKTNGLRIRRRVI